MRINLLIALLFLCFIACYKRDYTVPVEEPAVEWYIGTTRTIYESWIDSTIEIFDTSFSDSIKTTVVLPDSVAIEGIGSTWGRNLFRINDSGKYFIWRDAHAFYKYAVDTARDSLFGEYGYTNGFGSSRSYYRFYFHGRKL